jgi:hypothetical protein
MRDASVVPTDMARELAAEHGLHHFECSAFESKEIDTPFNYLASVFHRSYEATLKRLDKEAD